MSLLPWVRCRQDRELDEEIRTHLEMAAEDRPERDAEAGQGARRQFGNVGRVKEATREAWGGRWLEDLLDDSRYGLRTLRKNPTFALAAVLTLALGIGANTVIFGFADLLLNRPVALPRLERLVSISQISAGGERALLSPANYLVLRDAVKNLDALAAYEDWPAGYSTMARAEELSGVRVDRQYFAALGVKPLLGRVFLRQEYEPGRQFVAVLSFGFWTRRFGGDPNILGQTLRLDGEDYRIVGVMPSGFQFPPGAVDLWAPLALGESISGNRTLAAVGRLKDGATLNQVRAELKPLWNLLLARYPNANRGQQLEVTDLRRRLVDEDSRHFVVLFLFVVAFVLLIACANVANLQLARAAGRRQEFALRGAMGASRGRVVRQLLTESVLLAVLGGAGGLLLAFWGVEVLRAGMPVQVRQICDLNGLRVNTRALIFALLTATAAGILSGLAPALRGARAGLRNAMESGATRVTGGGGRLRSSFVVCQLVLTVVLLTGAGLMVKGFATLVSYPALAPETLLTFHINLPASQYRGPQARLDFYRRALDQMRTLAGVQAAAAISGLPFSFYENEVGVISGDQIGAAADQTRSVTAESISADYFRAMHVRLLAGRAFDSRDAADSAPVAIVSQMMAQRFWPGSDAIGKHLKLVENSSTTGWITVVGVAANVPHEIYDRAFRSVLYRPIEQATDVSMDFAVRVAGAPQSLVNPLRAAMARLDQDRPLVHLETMAVKVAGQASALRWVAALMGLAGLIAVVLAACGIYGVMAYAVAERRLEVGIRMALGAQTMAVLSMVMRQGLRLAGTGAAIGTVAALSLARFLSSLLYGVEAWDAAVFAEVLALLAACMALATFVPAWRAMRLTPMAALRHA